MINLKDKYLDKIVVIGLLVAIVALASCTAREADKAPVPDRVQQDFSYLETQWGIRPESLRLSGAGHILDFRYRVVDPEKAAAVLSESNKTYLIDQASGVKLSVPSSPKVGSLRQTTMTPEAGRIYFNLYSNRGKIIKPGSKVTVVIGDLRMENLTVE